MNPCELDSRIHISIHAPCEGGDHWYLYKWRLHGYFNPRPLRGGRRALLLWTVSRWIFQSTPPARGATWWRSDHGVHSWISIHAPCEGGDLQGISPETTIMISIHAPCEGGDGIDCIHKPIYAGFQSTPPARGATCGAGAKRGHTKISIHAPCEGGDVMGRWDTETFRISIHAPSEGGDFPV